MSQSHKSTFIRQFLKLIAFGSLVFMGYLIMQDFVLDKYRFVENEKLNSELVKKGVCDTMFEMQLHSVILKKTSEYIAVYNDERESEGMLSVLGAITFRNTDPQQAYFEITANGKECRASFMDLYEKYEVSEIASMITTDFEHIIDAIDRQETSKK